jgi:hypothetical protein
MKPIILLLIVAISEFFNAKMFTPPMKTFLVVGLSNASFKKVENTINPALKTTVAYRTCSAFDFPKALLSI